MVVRSLVAGSVAGSLSTSGEQIGVAPTLFRLSSENRLSLIWVLVYEKLMMPDMEEFFGASVFTQGLVDNGSEIDRLTPRESSFVDRKSQDEPLLSKIGDEGE